MKKVFVLSMFVLFGYTCIMAQPEGKRDPAAMKERIKERIKPLITTQAKITDEQADKVIDIYFDAQLETRKSTLNAELSEDDASKKLKEIADTRDRKIKKIPLTDEQAKAVSAVYDEQRKKMQQRGDSGGFRRTDN